MKKATFVQFAIILLLFPISGWAQTMEEWELKHELHKQRLAQEGLDDDGVLPAVVETVESEEEEAYSYGGWGLELGLAFDGSMVGSDTNPWSLAPRILAVWLSELPSIYWGFKFGFGGGLWFIEEQAPTMAMASASLLFGKYVLGVVGGTVRYLDHPVDDEPGYLDWTLHVGAELLLRGFVLETDLEWRPQSELADPARLSFLLLVGYQFDL